MFGHQMRPEDLGNPEYVINMAEAIQGFFATNWNSSQAHVTEWGALKVVVQGESLRKAYGLRKQLKRELQEREKVLADLQEQEGDWDTDGADLVEAHRQVPGTRDRLDCLV
ncbi:hypothetical protein NDU88_009979 [Pleurodeles waltl]|uniref:Uncharacterized protein n=1 Tax=Pleurodeles waltl TaxID=8319 RepID=A0AAV7PXH6_PLEWA|nr:hypothetical protein NDU88_009979 [Pleurodeles waltl]